MLVVRDNIYQDIISGVYIGSLSFNIQPLNLSWPDYANQDINLVHINDLMSAFNAGIDYTRDGR